MAWTAPLTWTGSLVTVANLNEQIRDNELFLRAAHGCRAFKSATQAVSDTNTDVVTFDSEDYDSDGIHSTSTNNSRFAAPFDGKYEALAIADVDADGSQHNGGFDVSIRKNAAGASGGGTLLESKGAQGHQRAQSLSASWEGVLTAGDYVEMFFHSAGEQRVLQNLTSGTSFKLIYRGS